MNSNDKVLIQQATPHLRLVDIVLYGSNFSRQNDLSNSNKTIQLEKRQIGYKTETHDAQPPLLLVKIDLGIRLADEDNNDHFYVQVDAEYLAVYEMDEQLSEEQLQAFADFNSLHNVWPFWRQHVFDIVQRAYLPPIEIALMVGTFEAS